MQIACDGNLKQGCRYVHQPRGSQAIFIGKRCRYLSLVHWNGEKHRPADSQKAEMYMKKRVKANVSTIIDQFPFVKALWSQICNKWSIPGRVSWRTERRVGCWAHGTWEIRRSFVLDQGARRRWDRWSSLILLWRLARDADNSHCGMGPVHIRELNMKWLISSLILIYYFSSNRQCNQPTYAPKQSTDLCHLKR